MVAEAPTATVSSVDAQQKFQKLKTHLHRRMIDAIDLSKAGQIPEAELRQQLRSLAAHLVSLEEVHLPVDQRDHMVREIMDEIYGFGPLEPLMTYWLTVRIVCSSNATVSCSRPMSGSPTKLTCCD